MGTLLLQAQDEHYSSSKSMTFQSPKKATRKSRNSSSSICRFSKPGEHILSTQSYFQSDNMCGSQRDGSYVRVDQGAISEMDTEFDSSDNMLTTRSSSSPKPPSVRSLGTCPEVSARKPAQSGKSSQKAFNKAEHANLFSSRSGNSAGFSGKRSGSKNTPRILTNKNVPKVPLTMAGSEGSGTKPSENLPMKVTILQRPQTKEEALSNISKFTGVPLAEVYAKNGVAAPFPNNSLFSNPTISSGMPENFVTAGGELLGSKENSFTGGKTGNHNQHDDTELCYTSTVPISAVEEGEISDLEGDELLAIQEEGRLQFIEPKNPSPAAFSTEWNDTSDSSGAVHPYLSDAKWSGLCFSISPPPSSLPIPKFATSARKKTTMSEVGYADELKAGVVLKRSVLATAVATNDLKKLLNLGFP